MRIYRWRGIDAVTRAGGALVCAVVLAVTLAGCVQQAAVPAFCPPGGIAGAPPPPMERARVIAAKKHAWEQSLGGPQAAQPYIQARLRGWPQHVLADPRSLPIDDRAFATRLARDAWRGIDALSDRAHALPVDNVRFGKTSVAIAVSHIGDYASGTDIGLYLIDLVAARELGLLAPTAAVARLRRTLATLQRLETFHGFLFNFYDTTSLERTSDFISFVDAAWLAAGLMVVRNSVPELAATCSRIIAQMDFGFFYDPATRRLSQGYYVRPRVRSPYDYGMLYTEARIGSLISIGKGDVPAAQWFAMVRSFPTDCAGQTQVPRGSTVKRVRGNLVSGGYYEWDGVRYVPSWGGSMFEALMPTLVLDEARYAPRSLGANDVAHATVQRRYALEKLGYAVWGISPSATPTGTGYAEYGVRVLGAHGYPVGAVTPYASALAMRVTPAVALANLRTLAAHYAMYGEYGFYDAVEPRSGTVAHAYLSLDQSMLFIALTNSLCDTCIERAFAADPIMRKVLPLIGEEDFFN